MRSGETASGGLRERYGSATAHLPAPLAVVDLDAFDANLDSLAGRAAGLPIRLASKSLRCRYLLERALGSAAVRGVLCYSLAEALWLSRAGVSEDLVVGYPTADEHALATLAADQAARERVTLMVDSAAHLDAVEDALRSAPEGPAVRVCLELDVSWRPLPGLHIGARRSPVFTARQAAELARTVVRRGAFRLTGLMGYEAQIAGVGDAAGNPVRAGAIRLMQRMSARELAARRAAAVAAVSEICPLEFVNGGGTGSIETTGADTSVTEVAAGSGLLGPALFDGYSRFRPRPAALFALPVVRKPTQEIATLFAGGYLASGTADASRLPSPYLPRGLRLTPLEGAGEVQTPVTGPAARHLAVGDRVWLRHAKAGELAERFETYHLVAGQRLERSVPTYRGEGATFG
ncbi:alanine racemase [Haloechinothrix sp. LS1_15]|uniref:alanine racemase n=1 Tax=Haloechinothrix sp. LS1_15 TaxID=2652248 RepID=UPI0029463110|nr:alanine racemase [Haloechinothrix sp. LS1_15]MDV6010895.1 amino acid deaminase/aldolase [Haloechinothrix sp. LS1_15]